MAARAAESAPTPKTVLLAGCGKMGAALLEIWRARFPETGFIILDPALPPGLEGDPRIIYGASPGALKKEIAASEIIVLAVKPQIMDAVCAGLKPYVSQDSLVISIAAGQTLEALGARFHPGQPIIRIMPNTPAAISRGMSVAIASSPVSTWQRRLAAALFESAGAFEWVGDESLMDAVTAISGSGPAYVFYLIEMLERAGRELGLPAALAENLARRTVEGSAALAESSPDLTAAQLRENVTSPGGTTEAALEILMDGEMQALFTRAAQAARRRGRELSD